MSSPAASWALMMQATASVYCSRNMVSPIAALNERPLRLRSNHSGRGYDPVIAVGSTRSRVVLSIATSSLSPRCSHDPRSVPKQGFNAEDAEDGAEVAKEYEHALRAQSLPPRPLRKPLRPLR